MNREHYKLLLAKNDWDAEKTITSLQDEHEAQLKTSFEKMFELEKKLKTKDNKLNRIEKLVDSCLGDEGDCGHLYNELSNLFDEGEQR